MAFEIETKGKLLFLLLSTLSLIIMMALTTLLWWLIKEALGDISYWVRLTILYLLRIFYILVICGIIILYLECYTKLFIKSFNRLIRFTITLLFPVNLFVGKILRIASDTIRESFVKVNNSFIRIGEVKYFGKDILILLPHCLQNYDCLYRVTNQINNCIDCGKCTITILKKLAIKYKTNIAIATGGTLARKIIVNTKPKCIIAVACQRDLVDGLLEVFPIPVYGVLNQRPFGPCTNTSVDVNEITNFLNYFVIEEAI